MHGNLAVAQLSGSSCIMQTDGLVGTTFHTLQVIQEDAEENYLEHEEQSPAKTIRQHITRHQTVTGLSGCPRGRGLCLNLPTSWLVQRKEAAEKTMLNW